MAETCPRGSNPYFSRRSLFFLRLRPPPRSTLFPYTTLFRSLYASAITSMPLRVSGVPPDLLVTSVSVSPSLPLSSRSVRSEEHTSELQSPYDLVCRLLLEKKHNLQHHTLPPLERHDARFERQ